MSKIEREMIIFRSPIVSLELTNPMSAFKKNRIRI